MSAEISTSTRYQSDQSVASLTRACANCVDRCLAVVDKLPADTYRFQDTNTSSIGTHMRHIIDRITCVLDGIEQDGVDYDFRDRDAELEQDRDCARSALHSIRQRFDCLTVGSMSNIRVRESIHEDFPAVDVVSTLERELMSLVSHTIHHLAIIVLLAQARGLRLDPDTGKAPSTIVYERLQAGTGRFV